MGSASKIVMSYGVCRSQVWLRSHVAVVAPIRPLAWVLPHAMNAALKKKTKQKLALERWILRHWENSALIFPIFILSAS